MCPCWFLHRSSYDSDEARAHRSHIHFRRSVWLQISLIAIRQLQACCLFDQPEFRSIAEARRRPFDDRSDLMWSRRCSQSLYLRYQSISRALEPPLQSLEASRDQAYGLDIVRELSTLFKSKERLSNVGVSDASEQNCTELD